MTKTTQTSNYCIAMGVGFMSPGNHRVIRCFGTTMPQTPESRFTPCTECPGTSPVLYWMLLPHCFLALYLPEEACSSFFFYLAAASWKPQDVEKQR
ncbi:uncharacterized protein V6R79_021553 [Siganus canaliculatus]